MKKIIFILAIIGMVFSSSYAISYDQQVKICKSSVKIFITSYKYGYATGSRIGCGYLASNIYMKIPSRKLSDTIYKICVLGVEAREIGYRIDLVNLSDELFMKCMEVFQNSIIS